MADVAETMREAREYISDKAAEAIHEQAAIQSIRKIMKESGIGVDRLKELVQADKDGQCVVLPCKVGEAVYTIKEEFNGFGIESKIEKRFIDGYGGNSLNPIWVISKSPYELHYFPSEFGKTVFLTREEAEAALEKLKKGGAND